MTIDFSKISESKRYKLMSNTIFPRPIAWITTEDEWYIHLENIGRVGSEFLIDSLREK